MAFKYKDRAKHLPEQCLEPGCNGKLHFTKNWYMPKSEAVCSKCGALHTVVMSPRHSRVGALRYTWCRVWPELGEKSPVWAPNKCEPTS